jgi:hypothetical protein
MPHDGAITFREIVGDLAVRQHTLGRIPAPLEAIE